MWDCILPRLQRLVVTRPHLVAVWALHRPWVVRDWKWLRNDRWRQEWAQPVIRSSKHVGAGSSCKLTSSSSRKLFQILSIYTSLSENCNSIQAVWKAKYVTEISVYKMNEYSNFLMWQWHARRIEHKSTFHKCQHSVYIWILHKTLLKIGIIEN